MRGCIFLYLFGSACTHAAFACGKKIYAIDICFCPSAVESTGTNNSKTEHGKIMSIFFLFLYIKGKKMEGGLVSLKILKVFPLKKNKRKKKNLLNNCL